MHYVALALAIFAGLWCFDRYQRWQADRCENARCVAIYRGLYHCDPPRLDGQIAPDKLGRGLTILAGVLAAGVCIAFVGAFVSDRPKAVTPPLTASQVDFLCRTGAAMAAADCPGRPNPSVAQGG